MGKWRYGVILDAGSSGTRVHIYRWLDSAVARKEAKDPELHSLPSLETHGKWTKKIHPGVSSFGETPSLIGSDHLQPLLEHALEVVPIHSVPDTPIFLLATAGVRLLPDLQRTKLLKQICAYTRKHTQFLLTDCDLHIQAIPGETEGLYGWIAANYLVGGFDAPEEHNHGKGHHTYGVLDMGGASAQIAFAPNATEAEKHSNDLQLLRLRSIDGQETDYKVFVTTWLGFGVNEARKRYIQHLLQGSGGDEVVELPDPCLPTGVKTTVKGALLSDSASPPDGEPYLLGTGKFDECLRATYPLLDKDAPCEDHPCLLHGVHTPAIDFDVNHFIGISEYWHTTHEIFEMAHKDKAYDFKTYQKRVSTFCRQDWASIQTGVADHNWGKKFDEQTAYEVCFKASWLINMLHYGIGIPREGLESTTGSGHNGTKEVLEQGKRKGFLEPFQAVNKIKQTEVSWTLGKMVLYAASQVPPADESSLPVGFGSNEPGIPMDFQYPGGVAHPSISNSSISESDDEFLVEQLHGKLFDSDSRRRIPGFLLFVFMVFIAGFYICGRDRRSRLYRKLFGSNGKKRRFFPGKVPFFSRGNTTSYERVLEDGERLEDPSTFELGDVESDDSDQGRARTPGWATPRGKPRAGLVGSDDMDRSGLVVRTESRERLALHSGRKSRTGSPARLKGSLTALVEQ
jgi:golgi apyrase